MTTGSGKPLQLHIEFVGAAESAAVPVLHISAQTSNERFPVERHKTQVNYAGHWFIVGIWPSSQGL